MLIFFNNWPSFQDQEVRNVWYIVLLDSKKRHSEVRVVTVHPITTPWYTFVTDWGSWDHNWWVWQLREIETSREISDQAPKDHNQLKTSWTPKPFLCWLSNFYQSSDFLLFSWLWAEQFNACTNYTDWYWSNSSLIIRWNSCVPIQSTRIWRASSFWIEATKILWYFICMQMNERKWWFLHHLSWCLTSWEAPAAILDFIEDYDQNPWRI